MTPDRELQNALDDFRAAENELLPSSAADRDDSWRLGALKALLAGTEPEACRRLTITFREMARLMRS